jgi:hypothetical protein
VNPHPKPRSSTETSVGLLVERNSVGPVVERHVEAEFLVLIAQENATWVRFARRGEIAKPLDRGKRHTPHRAVAAALNSTFRIPTNGRTFTAGDA